MPLFGSQSERFTFNCTSSDMSGLVTVLKYVLGIGFQLTVLLWYDLSITLCPYELENTLGLETSSTNISASVLPKIQVGTVNVILAESILEPFGTPNNLNIVPKANEQLLLS